MFFAMDSRPDQHTTWLSYYQPDDTRPPIPPCSVPSPDMPRLNSPIANTCTFRSPFNHGDAPDGNTTNLESQLSDDLYIDVPLEHIPTAGEAHKVRHPVSSKIRNHSVFFIQFFSPHVSTTTQRHVPKYHMACPQYIRLPKCP